MPRTQGFALLLVALLCAPPARAGGGAGTTAANFLKLDVGARPVALGGAFVGLADDIHAIAYNPAGLARLPRQQVGLMHSELFPGVHQEWGGYAHPMGRRGTWALALNFLVVDPFPAFNDVDQPSGELTSRDEAYQFAYARGVTDKLSLGLGAKYLRSRLDTQSASAYAVDLGVLYKPGDKLTLGASYLNLGKGMKFADESFPLPRAMKLGAALKPFGGKVTDRDLTLLTDFTFPQDRGTFVSFGAEILIYNALALRAGGNSGQDSGPGYSIGTGIQLFRNEKDKTEIDFDYAYVDYGQFAATHRATVTIKFGALASFGESEGPTLKGWKGAPRTAVPVIQPKEAAPEGEKPIPKEKRPADQQRDLIWVNP